MKTQTHVGWTPTGIACGSTASPDSDFGNQLGGGSKNTHSAPPLPAHNELPSATGTQTRHQTYSFSFDVMTYTFLMVSWMSHRPCHPLGRVTKSPADTLWTVPLTSVSVAFPSTT
mmetsp:Transcript_29938/g.53886  ORF Transcript_29938/g.53886 Transcript_29938/m.53886 type:complete len:115 (-) Transcript_29938:1411-1755(-)